MEWCHDMLIDPVLPWKHQSDRNKAMALCVLHLEQGRSMLIITIKSTNIKSYLKTASSISLNHKHLDPLSCMHVLETQCIKDVLSEVKRWECMPNGREHVTVKMVLQMHEKYKNNHLDSLE